MEHVLLWGNVNTQRPGRHAQAQTTGEAEYISKVIFNNDYTESMNVNTKINIAASSDEGVQADLQKLQPMQELGAVQ